MRDQRIWKNPIVWFGVAALMFSALGLFSSEFPGMGDTALDIPIHDTYFVVAHVHLVLAAVIFCLCCAVIYRVFSRLLHRRLNATLGLIHAALTLIGLLGIFFPMHWIGAFGTPGRYYDYSEFGTMEGTGGTVDLDRVVTGSTFLFLTGQSILIVNVIRTFLRPPGA